MGIKKGELVLNVSELIVKFGREVAVDNLSFEVKSGDVLAIIGPNGAGKTTLFKALLGICEYSGKIEWRRGVKIGYVPQRMEIETDIPLSVEEFLRLRNIKGFNKEAARKAIASVLLPEEILSSGFGEISVGQRQRILIAWALLGEPDVLLFDEPTADIDIAGQESIYSLIRHLQQSLGLTVILISHDLSVVYRHAELVLCLNRRKICYGTPVEALNESNLGELYGKSHGFYQHKQ